MEAARRDALEQVATYLESVTDVKNMDVTRDDIRTYTAGIVMVLDQKITTRLEGDTAIMLSSPIILFFMLLTLNVLTFFPRHFDLHNPFSLALLVIFFSRFFAYLLRESFELYSIKLILSALETYGKKKYNGNPGNINFPVPDDQDSGNKGICPKAIGQIISNKSRDKNAFSCPID